jgi:hypothetical protein
MLAADNPTDSEWITEVAEIAKALDAAVSRGVIPGDAVSDRMLELPAIHSDKAPSPITKLESVAPAQAPDILSAN